MTEIDRVMLIKTNADNNNNKFYEIRLFDDGSIKARNGRVGTGGVPRNYTGGQAKFDKIIANKTKPETKSKKGGYIRAKILGGGTSTVQNGSLASIAKQQIKFSNCKDTEALIRKLVQWNVHQITSSTTMKVNLGSGQIELPSGMGVLTQEAIADARDILQDIDKLKAKCGKKLWASTVNSYLMLVPQVIPHKKGWIDYLFKTDEEVKTQEELLDSLEGTLATISTTTQKPASKVFDLALVKITDRKILDKVGRLYKNTRQNRHSSSRLSVKTVYAVNIGYMADKFTSCSISNVMELWHGTGVGNLLSILKNGLIIPRRASHGRAFGNGVYFSDQSTKALNYACGYWSGSSANSCFMFLADVRMGKPYVPPRRGTWGSLPRQGFDSTFAKGGTSGVMNNEMIVYDLSQINLKFLVEFGQ